MVRGYEFVFVTDPGLSSSKKKELFSSLKKLIEEAGGKVEERQEWGVRELAYPIKKKTKGEYFIWQILVNGSLQLGELNVFLNQEEGILRYLFLKEGSS